jgi:hypothetical protein
MSRAGFRPWEILEKLAITIARNTKLRGKDMKRIFGIKWCGKLTKWQHGRGEKSKSWRKSQIRREGLEVALSL